MSNIEYSTGFRPKMSIKKKFVLSFSLAVLLPLTLLAVANTFIFKEQTKKASLNKVKITLNGAQRIYYSQGNRLKGAFLISSYNPYLINAITHKDIPFINSLIKSYKDAFGFASYIGITDNRGSLLASTSGALGFKPSLGGMIFNVFHTGFPVVKTALIRKIVLTRMGIKIANDESNMFLVTVVPFIHNGKVIGSIFGLINLNGNGYLPETIYNEYRLNTAVFASVFNTQVCLATLKIPGNVFGIGSKLPDSIHRKILEGKNFIGEMNYGGEDIFAAFHPIKNIDDKVIGSIAVFISNKEYLSIFRKTAFYAVVIIIIGLIMSFIISYFASKDTLNPIFAITKAIKNFTEGDLDTKLIIKTNDEFESIGKGFTEMAETVKDREERMRKYNIFSDFLVGSLDFEKIISSALNILEELLNLSSGIIYIYEKGTVLTGQDGNIGTYGDNSEGFLIPWKFYGIRKFVANKIKADEGITGHCLSKKKTVWFHDIPENAVLLKDALLENGGAGKAIDYGFCEVFPKDIAWFPLYVGDVNIGVLTVSSIHGFNEEDISFLEHAAKELSVALDNSRLHKKLNELSITDELTGLYNRRKLNEALEIEFDKAKRFNNSLSILIIDIDHFKSINDFYGHKVGDIVLAKLGSLLSKNTRNIDIAVRYGGEEFVIILSQTDFKNAIEAAKKIKKIIQDFKFTPIEKEITVSIGIASLPDEDIKSVDDMLKAGDDFLYEAKNSGRNRIVGSCSGKKVEID
ncbi:MAG: diguanylate cyclase [Candidatus Acidulodesulfobacterium ferriphilum]|uniref:Diguanylate cyclase n=1 Tax=Candidatus Acidulodesulfobacterium ferriphilum TaxID=2597223 RepID=A0A519BCB3_9DELT|nr:MAG: diguanylate cyclase [Candidatus Acidulodesulfobacterium ferriphilum]